ncbi:MAG: hypothetical protein FJZ87_00040 [Chloroflexi bacterium]|nr:hypothetical protein [Chloroflexota bacterium]
MKQRDSANRMTMVSNSYNGLGDRLTQGWRRAHPSILPFDEFEIGMMKIRNCPSVRWRCTRNKI